MIHSSATRKWLPLSSLAIILLLLPGFVLLATETAADEPAFPAFLFPWSAQIEGLYYTGGPHIWTNGIPSGLDFSDGNTNTPVLAAAAGTVFFVGKEICEGGVGCNTVKIRHDGGWETWYVHLSRFAEGLTQGSQVARGQYVGNEGGDGGFPVHIHLELRLNGALSVGITDLLMDGRSIQGARVLTPPREFHSRVISPVSKPTTTDMLVTRSITYFPR